MKYILVLFLSLGLPFQAASGAVAKTEAFSQIQTNFDPNAQLTPAEMQTVVKLAQRFGINKVAKVETKNIHPSPDFYVKATSTETVKGREISYVTVDIYRKQWTSNQLHISKSKYRTIGDFSVDPEDVITNRLTVFKIGEKAVRLDINKVPLTTADRLIAVFAAGKIRFSNPALAAKYKALDLSSLYSLWQEGGPNNQQPTYVLGFSLSPLHGRYYLFRLEADEVLVHDVYDIMS